MDNLLPLLLLLVLLPVDKQRIARGSSIFKWSLSSIDTKKRTHFLSAMQELYYLFMKIEIIGGRGNFTKNNLNVEI